MVIFIGDGAAAAIATFNKPCKNNDNKYYLYDVTI